MMSQAAMMKILERAGEYDKQRPAVPWALGIAGWECRTLLKRGDARALELFGYRRTASVKVTGLRFSAVKLRIGEDVRFEFAVVHRASRPVALRLEYAVDFVKASGRTTRKVFKISEGTFAPDEPRQFDRKHRFRDLTTRKHHPGKHRLTILINGEVSAEGSLMLTRAGAVRAKSCGRNGAA